MAGFKMDDYVDVAERIRQFYERFPDGRLTTGVPPTFVSIDGKSFIWYNARAYRTPDDPLPGSGWAAEPVPGPTPYTKDSELMNAETAAWGRAIVACGFETKKIASSQEVQARRGTTEPAVKVENLTAAPQTFAELTEAFHKLLVDDFWLAEAVEAKVPGKPRESLTRGDKAKVLQMLQTAYLRLLEHPRLSEGLADLPPSRAVVREVFASVLDGVELGGPPWRIPSYDQTLEKNRPELGPEEDPEAERLAEETIAG